MFKRALSLMKVRNDSSELDRPESSINHANLIQRKPYLKNIYNETYEFFKSNIPNVDGPILELGSGGGFIRRVLPNAVVSDVIAIPGLDLVCSGLMLPFKEESLSAIVMMNVFHHLQDVRLLFRECERTLKPGGRILMVEPANTGWSRLIYKHLHHEPFELAQKEWRLPKGGRMSVANDALPWIVFCRDAKKLKDEFPLLQLDFATPYMPLRYLLSGGVSFPQLLPSWTYSLLKAFEDLTSRFHPSTGMFMKIAMTRRDGA